MLRNKGLNERIAGLGNAASDAIMDIPWGHTEEGPDFWVDIHNRLERIERNARAWTAAQEPKF